MCLCLVTAWESDNRQIWSWSYRVPNLGFSISNRRRCDIEEVVPLLNLGTMDDMQRQSRGRHQYMQKWKMENRKWNCQLARSLKEEAIVKVITVLSLMTSKQQ